MGDKHIGGDRPYGEPPRKTCELSGTSNCGRWSNCAYPECVNTGLDEIYAGPMDDVTVGVVLAYGTHKGEIVYGTAKAGALAVNYNVPVLSENRTVETTMQKLQRIAREVLAKLTPDML